MYKQPNPFNKSVMSMQGRGLAETGITVYQRALRLAKVPGNELMFPMEAHPVLQTPTGKRVANFMGPGTNLKKRLLRGDEPISDMDKVSMAHDIRYSLAKTPAQIRDADVRFLKRARSSNDTRMNKALGISAIGSKYAYEAKKGVQYPKQADLDANDAGDQTLTQKLSQLEQQGYGDPLARLRLATSRMNRIGRGLKLGGQGLSLSGQGLNPAGGCYGRRRMCPRNMRRRRGRGLKLAGQGPRIEKVKRAVSGAIAYVKPHAQAALKKLGPIAKEAVKDYAIKSFKAYVAKKQSGGSIMMKGGDFGVVTIPLLIAAGTAIAKAIALGAAGAFGAWGANKALGGKGIKEVAERIKMTMQDFAPKALEKIKRAVDILNRNPEKVAQVSKWLEPVFKTSVEKKLKEAGVLKGSGFRDTGFRGTGLGADIGDWLEGLIRKVITKK